ncbi:nuclear transport factor 2 family protein [Chitinimonas sp.]|uniref:nuclear transport factor 2 family protein n=1 Tax=Chitinimonas sp. TaxID=1934313 RepID=UPI002F92746E
MINPDSPAAVVQRQLDAYNAHDLEALLATYAEDAQQFEHPGKLLASGKATLRERLAARLAEPNLHAHLLQRTVMGHLVIDQEIVTRTFPEGPGSMSMVAIYEVRDGLIQSASVSFGEKVLN